MTDIGPEQRKALEEKLKNMSPEEIQKIIQDQCIFCKIIAKQSPAYIIYEDDVVIGFFEINPANAGHVLLVPKKHFQILPQMPDQEAAYLFTMAKKLAPIVFEAMGAEGVEIRQRNGAAAGQMIPHVHVHIIPRYSEDKVPTNWEPKKLSEEEFKDAQRKILSVLANTMKQQAPTQQTQPEQPKSEPEKEEPKKPEKREKYTPRNP